MPLACSLPCLLASISSISSICPPSLYLEQHQSRNSHIPTYLPHSKSHTKAPATSHSSLQSQTSFFNATCSWDIRPGFVIILPASAATCVGGKVEKLWEALVMCEARVVQMKMVKKGSCGGRISRRVWRRFGLVWERKAERRLSKIS